MVNVTLDLQHDAAAVARCVSRERIFTIVRELIRYHEAELILSHVLLSSPSPFLTLWMAHFTARDSTKGLLIEST